MMHGRVGMMMDIDGGAAAYLGGSHNELDHPRDSSSRLHHDAGHMRSENYLGGDITAGMGPELVSIAPASSLAASIHAANVATVATVPASEHHSGSFSAVLASSGEPAGAEWPETEVSVGSGGHSDPGLMNPAVMHSNGSYPGGQYVIVPRTAAPALPTPMTTSAAAAAPAKLPSRFFVPPPNPTEQQKREPFLRLESQAKHSCKSSIRFWSSVLCHHHRRDHHAAHSDKSRVRIACVTTRPQGGRGNANAGQAATYNRGNKCPYKIFGVYQPPDEAGGGGNGSGKDEGHWVIIKSTLTHTCEASKAQDGRRNKSVFAAADLADVLEGRIPGVPPEEIARVRSPGGADVNEAQHWRKILQKHFGIELSTMQSYRVRTTLKKRWQTQLKERADADAAVAAEAKARAKTAAEAGSGAGAGEAFNAVTVPLVGPATSQAMVGSGVMVQQTPLMPEAGDGVHHGFATIPFTDDNVLSTTQVTAVPLSVGVEGTPAPSRVRPRDEAEGEAELLQPRRVRPRHA